MKKILTLLLCIAAMAFSASANELARECINVLLSNTSHTQLRASNNNAHLDANHDGVITIQDVTTIIDQALKQDQVNRAPAKEVDVDAIIDEILESDQPKANIGNVNEAIDRNLRQK